MAEGEQTTGRPRLSSNSQMILSCVIYWTRVKKNPPEEKKTLNRGKVQAHDGSPTLIGLEGRRLRLLALSAKGHGLLVRALPGPAPAGEPGEEGLTQDGVVLLGHALVADEDLVHGLAQQLAGLVLVDLGEGVVPAAGEAAAGHLDVPGALLNDLEVAEAGLELGELAVAEDAGGAAEEGHPEDDAGRLGAHTDDVEGFGLPK